MIRTGLYSGSFDPITLGHLDVIRRGARLVDRLVVAIGVHHGKAPLFSAEERQSMIEREAGAVVREAGCDLEVVTFDDLVIDAARRAGANFILRGIRDATDLDYEMRMCGMNAAVAPDVQTVFLPASAEVRHIAASLARQVAAMGGDVGHFVPPRVAEALVTRSRSAS
ncbi:pantetheine-phosphate adenylyltransferase [Lutibaculum baratangense]|uniref:Phosphopantetheine adenylyltransferase n=1 Tax=Lutibaculum baratangense AMV1 TaxID=631454 RepID=V4RTZ3_9HYPH|nr:pantetheine-phosphate adenylyltransferase [Lutibaculum baratangense]ESR26565.1 Phosphopantetheine adenylyltransferase [Lutibaculum baratangense AMV1]